MEPAVARCASTRAAAFRGDFRACAAGVGRYFWLMLVTFRRSAERRYAVVVQLPGKPTQTMDPAPGFDEHIPHDLVHYVVEAELGLKTGVFGRAAVGGGTFVAQGSSASPRERARQRRKQGRREQALQRQDADEQLKTSERIAYLCDLAWRRRQGQRPDPAFWHSPTPISQQDAERIERVLARLDRLAPLWHQLPVGGELSFVWPSAEPTKRASSETAA